MGQHDVVQLLLGHNADVHICNNEGVTPLHSAARCGYIEIARLLILERNAEVNAKDVEGSTPLHYATRGWSGGYLEVVRLLLDQGADADVRDLSGMTPCEVACGPRQEEIVQLFYQHAME
ncbi:ankyrin repeat protein [Lactarius deliciosus]|nr:ankyrin repeat protein [Lactarius deliciosus]